MAASKLTQKQKLFAQEYLVDLNATQAAQRAGYSKKTAGTKGSNLLANSAVQKLVQAAIQKREQRIEISQDQILIELVRIGFGDPREVLSWTGNSLTLKDSNELSEGAAASIAEVVETKQGLKIKRHDKVKAIELLMRHKGMLSDKLNSSHPQNMGVAKCQEKALAAKAELLRLRKEREVVEEDDSNSSATFGRLANSSKHTKSGNLPNPANPASLFNLGNLVSTAENSDSCKLKIMHEPEQLKLIKAESVGHGSV